MKNKFFKIRHIFSSIFIRSKEIIFERLEPKNRVLDKILIKAKKDSRKAGLRKDEKQKKFIIISFRKSVELKKQKSLKKLNERLSTLKIKLGKIIDLEEKVVLEQELAKFQSEHFQEMVNNLNPIESLEVLYKDMENRLNEVLSQIEEERPTKLSALDKGAFFYLVSLAIMILEAYTMTPVWEKLLDLPYILAILAANIFSFILVFTAHLIGDAIYSGRRQLLGALTVGFGILASITIARIMVESHHWVIISFILWMLYGVSVILSIRRFKNAKNFELLTEKSRLLKAMAKVKMEMLQLMGKSSKLAIDSQLYASLSTSEKLEGIRLKKNSLAQKIERVTEEIKEEESFFNSYIDEGINQIEAAYCKGENDSLNVKTNTEKKSFWGNQAAAMCLAFLLLFSTTGCSNFSKPEPDSYAVIFLLDRSLSTPIENLLPAKEARNEIFDVVRFNDDHNNGFQGYVELSIIGDGTISPSQRIDLPKTGMLLFEKRDSVRVKRADFEVDLLGGIEGLYAKEMEANTSNIYRNIGFRLKQLSKSTEKTRTLIVVSDLIPQSSLLDFSKYKNPKRIRDNYGILKSLLDKELELKDLTGIEIRVYYADSDTSDLSYYSRDFFQWYFENLGAKVIMSSAI